MPLQFSESRYIKVSVVTVRLHFSRLSKCIDLLVYILSMESISWSAVLFRLLQLVNTSSTHYMDKQVGLCSNSCSYNLEKSDQAWKKNYLICLILQFGFKLIIWCFLLLYCLKTIEILLNERCEYCFSYNETLGHTFLMMITTAVEYKLLFRLTFS